MDLKTFRTLANASFDLDLTDFTAAVLHDVELMFGTGMALQVAAQLRFSARPRGATAEKYADWFAESTIAELQHLDDWPLICDIVGQKLRAASHNHAVRGMLKEKEKQTAKRVKERLKSGVTENAD